MLITSLHRAPQHTVRLRLAVGLVAGTAALLAIIAQVAGGQNHVHSADPASASPAAAVKQAGGMTMPAPAPAHDNGALHMEMTPAIRGTAADSARAAAVAATLKAALAKYRDTTAAVADGYRMFLPQLNEQKIYHFTNKWRGLQEAFRFNAERPTSLLYRKDASGTFVLVGAMYTAPKRFDLEKLDARIPLSVARWHKHVNWCLPKRAEPARWKQQRDGEPVFGPQSAIATREACDAVGGRFYPSLLGWMIHANVMAGDDPAFIWGDDHAGHDMADGMKHDAMH